MKYLAIILLFASCVSTNKAIRHLEKKDLLDDLCAEKFPVKETIITKDSVHFDTLYWENDIFITDTFLVKGDTITLSKKCPPSQTLTKTVIKEVTKVQRDRAYEEVQGDSIRVLTSDKDRLLGQVDQLKKSEDQERKDKNKWKWRFFALLTLVIVYVGLKLKFKLPF